MTNAFENFGDGDILEAGAAGVTTERASGLNNITRELNTRPITYKHQKDLNVLGNTFATIGSHLVAANDFLSDDIADIRAYTFGYLGSVEVRLKVSGLEAGFDINSNIGISNVVGVRGWSINYQVMQGGLGSVVNNPSGVFLFTSSTREGLKTTDQFDVIRADGTPIWITGTWVALLQARNTNSAGSTFGRFVFQKISSTVL